MNNSEVKQMNISDIKQTNNSDKEQINDYISPDRNEVIRYLGYRGITEPDEKLNALIDECIKEMQAKVCRAKQL